MWALMATPSASPSFAGCSFSKSLTIRTNNWNDEEDYRSPIPEKLQWRAWAANPEGITGDELLTFVNGELFPGLKELTCRGKQGDRRRVVRGVFEDAYNYMKSGQLMRQVVNKINEVDFNDLAERQHFGDIYEQILNDLQSAGNAGEYYTPRAVTAFMVTASTRSPAKSARSRLRHRRLLDLRAAPHARAVCEETRRRTKDASRLARRREKAATPHAMRHEYAAAQHRGPQFRPPR